MNSNKHPAEHGPLQFPQHHFLLSQHHSEKTNCATISQHEMTKRLSISVCLNTVPGNSFPFFSIHHRAVAEAFRAAWYSERGEVR